MQQLQFHETDVNFPEVMEELPPIDYEQMFEEPIPEQMFEGLSPLLTELAEWEKACRKEGRSPGIINNTNGKAFIVHAILGDVSLYQRNDFNYDEYCRRTRSLGFIPRTREYWEQDPHVDPNHYQNDARFRFEGGDDTPTVHLPDYVRNIAYNGDPLNYYPAVTTDGVYAFSRSEYSNGNLWDRVRDRRFTLYEGTYTRTQLWTLLSEFFVMTLDELQSPFWRALLEAEVLWVYTVLRGHEPPRMYGQWISHTTPLSFGGQDE